ncbi:Rho termination factor N-terminal domain-containing protein [Paenibacillus sp. PK3_47]|uniref:Rho termination factor N-terminal domain-containing protein n=1 Tax=Paenibacillus sp. PK3_47 TaxID=2072642 RepID=UPI00201D5B36|nr:Rho termination factor N-terminal domain-containing protein [Paenibacillus sp. PK3_47]
MTYRGNNASLRLYSIRFEPAKPVLVEDSDVLEKLHEHPDFEVKAEKIIPLEDLTVAQLKDKAKKAGIDGFADLKKPELIAALKALEGGGVPDANNDTP